MTPALTPAPTPAKIPAEKTDPQSSPRIGRSELLVAFALLAMAIGILFWTAPKDGDFWWSDAPRHALDGVFVRDLVYHHPWHNLRQYAMDYYLQYPALSIAFYPPLFPVVEAVFFQLFGVSQSTALLCIAFFYLLAAWGGYLLVRRWMNPVAAFASALLFVGLPEVALWGRQVMLEIPTVALMLWSAWVFTGYLERPTASKWYWSMALLLGATYTKQPAAFLAVVYAVALYLKFGATILRERRIWLGAAAFAIGLIPLGVMFLKFGAVNVNSVVGGQWTSYPATTLAGWLFYIKSLPRQATWPIALLAGGELVALLWTRGRRVKGLILSWLIVGYIFFSLVALKEPRHTILILVPVAILAVSLLDRLPRHYAQAAMVTAAVATFATTAWGRPVPRVSGYREAVQYVAQHAPANGVVLFYGYRDGSFVFNVRSAAARQDLSVLRADKILVRVVQRRDLGVREKPFSEAETMDLLSRVNARYIVAQPGFWNDLKVMREFEKLLETAHFEKRRSIPVVSNARVPESRLDIYENMDVSATGNRSVRLELPMIGTFVEGSLGKP
jgi:4-amino-4-deoxy-L-arabinose transferase-like glycosyltransferase